MYAAELIEKAVSTATEAIATTEGSIALVFAALAAVLILIGSFVKTMAPLRWLQVGSNVGFVVYGALMPSFPVLLLHALLVPINLYRLIEIIRLTERVRRVTQSKDTSGLWMRPYMKRRRLKAGTVLFHKGDVADHLYMLTKGRIELVEISAELPAGRLFGEIAFFAPDKRRTMTARCTEDSEVLAINENTVHQLYFQNPSFGFQVIGLVAGRLIADSQRLEALLKARQGDGGAVAADAPTRAA
jgi:CRP-like cAMP-binding protein